MIKSLGNADSYIAARQTKVFLKMLMLLKFGNKLNPKNMFDLVQIIDTLVQSPIKLALEKLIDIVPSKPVEQVQTKCKEAVIYLLEECPQKLPEDVSVLLEKVTKIAQYLTDLTTALVSIPTTPTRNAKRKRDAYENSEKDEKQENMVDDIVVVKQEQNFESKQIDIAVTWTEDELTIISAVIHKRQYRPDVDISTSTSGLGSQLAIFPQRQKPRNDGGEEVEQDQNFVF